MTRTTLGIDLGGCMSGNSAYALVKWKEHKAKHITLIKEPKHKEHHQCSTFLKEILIEYPSDAIAIDAPFSLPRALVDTSFTPLPREGAKGEISNPYLYRYTDYWLYKEYALRPMPPAGDRIGRLTARMIEMLRYFSYHAPSLRLPHGKTPVYEVYPKQIALTLGYEKYRHHKDEILKTFGIDKEVDEHLLDAILASYCAAAILDGKTVFPPREAADEGWCYPLLN